MLNLSISCSFLIKLLISNLVYSGTGEEAKIKNRIYEKEERDEMIM